MNRLSTLKVSTMQDFPISVRNPLSGRAQLATELTISADEFDVYEIAEPPIIIAFHLREFNVCPPAPLCCISKLTEALVLGHDSVC